MTLLAPAPAPADWTPGVPLYPHPDTTSNPDAQSTRPIIEFLSDAASNALDNTLASDATETDVRFCRTCEVLWASQTHCWVCDRYARPPRSRYGASFAVYHWIGDVLLR